jgi:hypothetical protein
MCADPQVMTMIDTVVDEFVSRKQMFTAFEVTLTVNERRKAAGDYEWLSHRDLRGDIHNAIRPYLQQGTYRKHLQDVGAPDPAYVYCPEGEDPANYKPLPRHKPANQPAPAPVATPVLPSISMTQPSAPAAPPVSANNWAGVALTSGVAAAQSLTSPNTNDNDATTPDKFGRLNIPTSVVKEAFFKPGDKAFLFRDTHQGKPCIIVSLSSDWNDDRLTEYTVEPSCGIKIRPGVIERANIGAGPYEFAGSSNHIRVTSKC